MSDLRRELVRKAFHMLSLVYWAAFLLISGLYLTLRGYHAFDGDHAYRLPLLLQRVTGMAKVFQVPPRS